ncbi:NAD-dependent epimerase/dehydratase family protein [Candidatus Woesearchaeota archaeon]|nr:MAG: NAD-dependent epimerase/dehydratase family protein [Candidatus Woesearchaeota archaeon]
MSNILVTGAAGFVGSYVAKALVERGDNVIAVDNFNDYYVLSTGNEKYASLKDERYESLVGGKAKLYRADITDLKAMRKIFEENRIDKVCHLAAQAGVRYSVQNPFVYERVNIGGTLNLLELAKEFKVKSFVFASSSSVYGNSTPVPFREDAKTEQPISVYAATKKAGESLCHVYHALFGMKITCLRLFTVYGPWGRPDMATMLFIEKILNGKPVKVFGEGKLERDFTFVTDIADGIVSALDRELDFEIINLGNNSPVMLSRFLEIIENELGKKAEKDYVPVPPGDVQRTYADITKAGKLLGFKPQTSIERGLAATVRWYLDLYGSGKV